MNQENSKQESDNTESTPGRYRNDPHGHLARFIHQVFASLNITPGILARMIRQSSILSRGRISKSQLSNDRTNLLGAAEKGYMTLNTVIKLLAVIDIRSIRFDVTLTHGNGKESHHHMTIEVESAVAGMKTDNDDNVTLPYSGEDNVETKV